MKLKIGLEVFSINNNVSAINSYLTEHILFAGNRLYLRNRTKAWFIQKISSGGPEILLFSLIIQEECCGLDLLFYFIENCRRRGGKNSSIRCYLGSAVHSLCSNTSAAVLLNHKVNLNCTQAITGQNVPVFLYIF